MCVKACMSAFRSSNSYAVWSRTQDEGGKIERARDGEGGGGGEGGERPEGSVCLSVRLCG